MVMAQFEREMCIERPVAEVFAFFLQPVNIVLLTPPELHLRIVDGPERLALGARLTLRGRRWGFSHQVESEITRFEPETEFVDTQVKGPFQMWIHTHSFSAIPGGTRVRDAIDFEPPGGLLGLVVTARFVEKDLEGIFAYRAQKLREIFGNAHAP
jgi:ligand-binding SRPBCC domain-containing protein